MRLRLSHALFFAASVLGAPSALAQPRPDAPRVEPVHARPPVRPTSIEIAASAQELCERGDTDEAITALASALTQKSDPDIAAALAYCEVKTRRWAAAADHLQIALRGAPEGPTRKALEDRLLEARAHVGMLSITVNVEGADLFVGSRFVGQSPLGDAVFADPGRNVVTVKKPNFDEAERIVEVPLRGTAGVKIELVAGGRTPNPFARATRTRVPFFVLGGVGLVTVGTGAALLAAGLSRGAAADTVLAELGAAYPHQAAPCAPAHAGCASVKSLRAGRDTFMNAGAGALAGGGVLLGAAILYGVWAFAGDAPSSTGALTLAPVATPSGGGLWMTGRF